MTPPLLVPLPTGGFMGTAQTLRRPSPPPARPKGAPVLPPPARVSPRTSDDAPKAKATPQPHAPSPVVFVRPAPAPKPPPPPRPLSTRERVVLAVLDIHDDIPLGPVPWVAVVLECWRRWPAVFGLRGHETTHPDSNRVLARLSGCAADGYVSSDGRGGWTPTTAALSLHAALRARKGAQ